MQKAFRMGSLPWRASGLLVLLALWEMAPGLAWVDPKFLPSFSTVMRTIYHQWLNGFLWVHLVVSLWRVVTGLLIALLIGIPLGFVLGGFGKTVVQTFNPLFRILSQANPFSLMPVFILCFGIGEAAKLAVIAWVCLWPVLFNTINGVQNIDPDLIKAARAVGLKSVGLGTRVFFPAVAPSIFTGLRIGVEMAFFILIAAEMIGAIAGLGWLLHTAAHLYQIPWLYAAATCIVFLGVLLNRCLLWLENHLYFWKEDDGGLRDDQNGKMAVKLRRRPRRWEYALISFLIIGIIVSGGRLAVKINHDGGFEAPHLDHRPSPEVPNFGSSGGI